MTRIKKIVMATVLAFGAMGSTAAFAGERPEAHGVQEVRYDRADYRRGEERREHEERREQMAYRYRHFRPIRRWGC
jgi:hypothetical protein